jgi:uncharacterized protein with HEPN domain
MSECRIGKTFIHDILESIEKIEFFLSNITYEEFLSDVKTQDAVLRNLEIIGEASRRVDMVTQEQMSDIDWSGMIGMRNFLSHQYFRTDLQIVWETCKNDIEILKTKLHGYGYC